ncbi:osteopontin-like [Podarcis raffonei]|uniref:osteopontin-like n=1 Tax=Podarcis raffonei TaxID=65483 RepID=UPI0023299730|nr:osteopontin-like [Podarcis raffonei]
MPGVCSHPAEEEERKRLSKPRLLQAPLSDNIFFRGSFTMKTAVICWCLFSIALALPIHHEKDGRVERDQEIKKSAEVNSDHHGKEAEAAKEKTEQEHWFLEGSDKTKEGKDHSSPADSDKTKEEKEHSSKAEGDKPKEEKDSKDKPTSKSTRALKTPDAENQPAFKDLEKVGLKSFALDVREDDQEAEDAENHPAVRQLQALLEDFQDAANRPAVKQLQAPAEDNQNSPASDLTEVDQENSPASDTREDDQEDAENHPAVKQLQAPAEDYQSAPSSDEAIEKIEPQVSFLTEENNNVAEQQVFDESEPSADVLGDFQDSEEAEA